METAIKGVPVTELSANPPQGIVSVGGEWYYDDYAPGRGVASLGVEAAPAAPAEALTGAPVSPPPPPEERNRILDMFRN
jgi:penicillin-binding protein 1A